MSNPEMRKTNRQFLEMAIIKLYDDEVAKHPEGIHHSEVEKLIAPKVQEILDHIKGGGSHGVHS